MNVDVHEVAKMLISKKLIVHTHALNSDTSSAFPCWEFQNGVILVPGKASQDEFFGNRDEIDPCGNDVVSSIEETDVVKEWLVAELKESIDASISEFGEDSVPQCAIDLAVSEPTSLKGYAVGDSAEPGSYHRVDGVYLCDEGAFDCSSVEDFRKTADDLRDNCDYDCDFALVGTYVNGEESIIEWH